MKIVKITWVDSYGVGQNWADIDKPKDEHHICVSVGFLAGDGKKVKVLVPHVSLEDGKEDQGCGDMAIPACSILDIDELVVECKAK